MKSNTVEGTWRWGQDTAKEKLSYLHACYMPNKKQWSIFEWQYLDKRDLVKPTSVWTFKDVNSERGTELFRNLGFDKNQFPNPKPVGTIERILQIATKKDAIVLDSFAGSGTTAHAVLRQNRADGGHRRFVLVELMDYAETITAERVRRVMAGYGDGEKAVEGTGGGFSFYELARRAHPCRRQTQRRRASRGDSKLHLLYGDARGLCAAGRAVPARRKGRYGVLLHLREGARNDARRKDFQHTQDTRRKLRHLRRLLHPLTRGTRAPSHLLQKNTARHRAHVTRRTGWMDTVDAIVHSPYILICSSRIISNRCMNRTPIWRQMSGIFTFVVFAAGKTSKVTTVCSPALAAAISQGSATDKKEFLYSSLYCEFIITRSATFR